MLSPRLAAVAFAVEIEAAIVVVIEGATVAGIAVAFAVGLPAVDLLAAAFAADLLVVDFAVVPLGVIRAAGLPAVVSLRSLRGSTPTAMA